MQFPVLYSRILLVIHSMYNSLQQNKILYPTDAMWMACEESNTSVCIQDSLYLFVRIAGGIHSFYQIQKGIYEIKRKVSLMKELLILFQKSEEFLSCAQHHLTISSAQVTTNTLVQLDRHSPSPRTPQTALFLTLVLPTSPPEFPDNSRGKALAAVIKRTEAKD